MEYILSGKSDDAAFEPIPEDELPFYQDTGARTRKAFSGLIAPADLEVLEECRARAFMLDLRFDVNGARIGWAPIWGFTPLLGDILVTYLAMKFIDMLDQVEGGLPPWLRLEMKSNVFANFFINLFPYLGDVLSAWYRVNARNYILLEKYLVKKYEGGETV